MNRDFPCFTHLHLLSSDLFSSELSRLSDSSLLCFSSVHIVGSLASKLPSMISKWNQSSNGEVIKENENMPLRRNIAQSTCFFDVNEP